jgi:hypothetical protein
MNHFCCLLQTSDFIDSRLAYLHGLKLAADSLEVALSVRHCFG